MLITFDFDETLTRPTWNARYGYFEPSDNPNHDAMAKLRSFHEQGYEIRIVTTRWRSEEVNEFVRQHQLPVSSVHCTEGELKANILQELGSKLHFDDNEAEAIANLEVDIATMIVSHHFDLKESKEICRFIEYQAEEFIDMAN
ncbi:MAG: hypothetical protein AAFY50_06275 [Cyanobacteria bacterium J06648_1]